jgi:hypothetical protein
LNSVRPLCQDGRISGEIYMGDAFIIDAVRTPRSIGKVGKGALAHMHPQHLAATVLTALKDRNHLNTAEVDDVIWGTSAQAGKQGGDMGRMAALDAGYDVKASGVTLDRFCGSGHQPGRGRDHVRHGRSGDRRGHRDDVARQCLGRGTTRRRTEGGRRWPRHRQ